MIFTQKWQFRLKMKISKFLGIQPDITYMMWVINWPAISLSLISKFPRTFIFNLWRSPFSICHITKIHFSRWSIRKCSSIMTCQSTQVSIFCSFATASSLYGQLIIIFIKRIDSGNFYFFFKCVGRIFDLIFDFSVKFHVERCVFIWGLYSFCVRFHWIQFLRPRKNDINVIRQWDQIDPISTHIIEREIYRWIRIWGQTFNSAHTLQRKAISKNLRGRTSKTYDHFSFQNQQSESII